MNSPIVSIIVPVYNVREYLSRCLDSLTSQTLRDIEIIAIDDGSTDGSSSILDSYAGKDTRIKAFHVENGGVSKARNIGIDNAEGEYVGFVDSDDYVEPRMFERLVDVAYETEAECVQCSFDIVDGSAEETIPQLKQNYYTIEGNGEIVKSFFNERIENSVCNKLFKRSDIGQDRFPLDLQFAEDFYFNAMFVLKCRKMALIDDVLYHYYSRESSASHDIISDKHLKGFQVYDIAKLNNTEEDVLRVIAEKELSESLRFLDSSIGHEEVSDKGLAGLIRRIKTGRRWIKGNVYMTGARRLRARIVCLSPKFSISVVKVLKKLR